MMKDIAMSKARSQRAHDKGQKKIFSQIKNALRKVRPAPQSNIVGQLRYLSVKILKLLRPNRRWPKHSLFCAKGCCQKPYSLYLYFLQRELTWGNDGHLL